MKKLIFFVAILFCCSTGYAQNAEVKTTPDDVYSEKGFVVRRGSFKAGKQKFKFYGLYSADGTVCVACWPLIGDLLTVAPGTKIIAKNAITSTEKSLCYIPSTVTQISTAAIRTGIVVEIYDNDAVTELENK